MIKITVKEQFDGRHRLFINWLNSTGEYEAKVGGKNNWNGINAGDHGFPQKMWSNLWDNFYRDNPKFLSANNVCISIWIDQQKNGATKYYHVGERFNYTETRFLSDHINLSDAVKEVEEIVSWNFGMKKCCSFSLEDNKTIKSAGIRPF